MPGSSDLKKKALIAESWAALIAPNEAPEFLARLRLAYMQATAKKPLSKSECSLAETVKQNAERLKEVKKDAQVLPARTNETEILSFVLCTPLSPRSEDCL